MVQLCSARLDQPLGSYSARLALFRAAFWSPFYPHFDNFELLGGCQLALKTVLDPKK